MDMNADRESFRNALIWITPGEVEQYEFCPADQAMIRKMVEG